MLTVQPLTSGLKVELGAPAPSIAPEILARVEAIWQQEKSKRGDALFNGQIFSIHQSTSDRIVGWMTEYRYFLAQQRDTALHAVLKIKPLAVTGVLRCKDGIVFGRRAGQTEMDANLWELVPSGSVDDTAVENDGRLNLERCLLAELEGETGIRASEVTIPPKAVALVEDPQTRVTDVCLVLTVDWTAGQIRQRFAAIKNREYTALEIVAVGAIPEFRLKSGASLSEVSGALLDIVIPRL
jgi:hypothetical protein